MKRTFFYTLIGLFFFISNVVYANNSSLGKIINHREWITGHLKLKYKISNAEQKTITHINDKIVKSEYPDDVKEYVHTGHIIDSIDTQDDAPYQTITKINSTFWVDIHGFETTNEPQLFTVLQETCIDSRDDASGNQSTCVNSEDTIYVDGILVLNIRKLNIQAYNLKPGEYTISTEMMIRQILPQPKTSIGYTSSNSLAFSVHD